MFIAVLIGVILLVASIALMVWKQNATPAPVGNENGYNYKEKSPDFILNWNISKSIVMFIFAVVLISTPKLFMYAERGYSYYLVYPTGSDDVIMSQGVKMRWFAKVDKWQNYIDVKVVSSETEQDDEELEGIMKPIGLRFIDQVTAEGYISTRFQLPTDENQFKKLAVKYRTMSNLVNNTIIPTCKEQFTNTGYMFAAQDYISGEAQSFRQTFEEQLVNGSYRVEKIEHKDTVYDGSIQQNNRRIKEIQIRYEVKKIEDASGKPIRIPNEITSNGILVSQVIVDNVELDPAFKKRLELQRDESAKRQLEQQMIETAKASQQRIIAEGERDKAAERVTQEKEQVKALIAIETKLKQESTNKELAAIALETERLLATKKKVSADAQYYENAKLVQAGLTPQEKAEWNYKTAVGVAGELSKLKFPSTMIMGGSDNSGTPLESLIGAAMAKQLTGDNK